jgi:RNA polymerase sigma-70 factor, ECF subfamily
MDDTMGVLILEGQRRALGPVKRILRHHPDDVDDVLQQAALRALENAHQYRGQAAFTTWFTRIAINTAFMHLRRRPIKCASDFISIDDESESHQLELLSRVRSSEPDPEQQAIHSQRAGRVKVALHLAIEGLPPLQRDAALIWLHEGTAKSNAEKSRRHQARVKLRAREELSELATI